MRRKFKEALAVSLVFGFIGWWAVWYMAAQTNATLPPASQQPVDFGSCFFGFVFTFGTTAFFCLCASVRQKRTKNGEDRPKPIDL